MGLASNMSDSRAPPERDKPAEIQSFAPAAVTASHRQNNQRRGTTACNWSSIPRQQWLNASGL